MFIVYEPGDIVKLRRTYEYDDLNDWGLKEDELEALRAAEDEQLNAEIVGEETDGYYNIVVCYEDGRQRRFDAICNYHLTPATDDALALLDIGEFANR